MDYKKVYQKYDKKLSQILSAHRYQHSMRVVDTALSINQYFFLDRELVALAGLVHDRGKEIPEERLVKLAKQTDLLIDEAEEYNPELLHGPIGAYLLSQEGIKELDLLNAVRYHTTGRPKMSQLEILIFLADLVEPARDYPKSEMLRKLAFRTPVTAMRKALDWTLEYLIRDELVIHPLTIQARNYYLYNREFSINK